MSITCILIGQDNLLIQCGQILLDHNCSIKWVISSTQSVQNWCEKNTISYLNSLEDLTDRQEGMVDYLFSIVNAKILKQNVLNLARFGAINYHDALLPKYAGVNATTWAIIHREKYHGITWHIMNEGIDTGDIVYQSSFPITHNDTSLTLNLRCFEEAVKGFSVIIQSIENATLSMKKQGIEERTYFGPHHVLPNNGFIHWKTDAAIEIDALCRALNFGNYTNNVGSLKLLLDDSYFIIQEVELSTLSSNIHQGGVILAIENNKLLISTISQPIWITKLTTVEGQKVVINQLIQQTNLAVHDQLPLLDDVNLERNHSFYKNALRYEKFWLPKLAQIIEHTTFCDRIFNENKLPAELNPVLMQTAVDDPSLYLLASIFIYLYRLNNYEPSTVFLCFPQPSQTDTLFSTNFPVTLELKSDFTCHQVIDILKEQRNVIAKHENYLSDIYVRQPLLKSLDKHCEITIGMPGAVIPKNALIHFAIDPESKIISPSHRINDQYQGGILTPIIKNMSDHVENILHAIQENPDQVIHQLFFLTQEEKKHLLTWSVGEYKPLPSNTITELFERHVQSSPERPAIYQDKQVMNYGQLWEEAEKITAFVHTLKLPLQSQIGIHVPLGREMLVLILGLLKAGCVVVPFQVKEPIPSIDLLQLSIIISSKPLIQDFTIPLYEIKHILRIAPEITNTIPTYRSSHKQSYFLLPNLETVTQTHIINYAYWYARATQMTPESMLELSSEVTQSIPYKVLLSYLLTPLFIGAVLGAIKNPLAISDDSCCSTISS